MACSDLTLGVGTPAYMAPEVLRAEHCGQAADVFSFGVVVWEALEGRVPDLVQQERPDRRGGSWLIALEELLASGARLRFSEGAPQQLVDIAAACMAASPEDRPTFAALTQRLGVM